MMKKRTGGLVEREVGKRCREMRNNGVIRIRVPWREKLGNVVLIRKIEREKKVRRGLPERKTSYKGDQAYKKGKNLQLDTPGARDARARLSRDGHFSREGREKGPGAGKMEGDSKSHLTSRKRLSKEGSWERSGVSKAGSVLCQRPAGEH